MFSNIFRKLAGLKRGHKAKEVPEPQEVVDRGEPRDFPPAKAEAPNVDIPSRIKVGLELKAVPTKQPSKPRSWKVRVTRLDQEGIWIGLLPDEDPMDVTEGDTVSLVLFDFKDNVRYSYDCPVLRTFKGGVGSASFLLAPPTRIEKKPTDIALKDKRRHFRVAFELPAECRPVIGNKLGEPVTAHGKDISLSGLAVTSPKAFPEGTELEIRVLSWNFPLKVRAFIVRCQPLADGRYVVAVSFPPDMSAISLDLISQFVLENQRNRV